MIKLNWMYESYPGKWYFDYTRDDVPKFKIIDDAPDYFTAMRLFNRFIYLGFDSGLSDEWLDKQLEAA